MTSPEKLKAPTIKNNSSSKLSKNLEENPFKNLIFHKGIKRIFNKKESSKINRWVALLSISVLDKSCNDINIFLLSLLIFFIILNSKSLSSYKLLLLLPIFKSQFLTDREISYLQQIPLNHLETINDFL